MKKEVLNYKNFNYIVSVPDNFSKGEKYPAIIVLHGAGGRGNNIDALVNNPYFAETETMDNNVISFMPQCFSNSWFDIFEQLQEFVKYIVSKDYVDENKVYLMGASMGGYATWQLAMTMPEIFAAIVPICGGGMYWNAERLLNMGVWAFHGSDDPIVLKSESENMVNAINRFGGSAKLTICEGVEHNSWLNAYGSNEVFEWLFSHSKKRYENGENLFDNQEIFG